MYNQKLANRSGAADWVSDAIAVGAGGHRVASFTILWAAFAATAGTLSFEGTDDPTNAAASWVPITVAKSHGTFPAVGAVAAKALVLLSNCPGWVRVKYTRSAGGTADQFQTWCTLTT